MSIRPEILALAVILIFVSIVLLMLRSARQRSAEKTHLAQTLGYQEVTSRPSELIRRAETLYKRRDHQSIQVDQVYAREDWDQKFYLFDISDSNQDEGDLGSAVFGVISNQLDLPLFSLTTLPGFSSDSFFGGIMDSLMDKVLAKADKYLGMGRIELEDRPDLDDQLIIFGKDQDAVKQLLETIDLRFISQFKSPVHITGIDDFLTVDFTDMGPLNEEEYDLIAQHREFSRIFDQFKK